jgi:hypothetical protein
VAKRSGTYAVVKTKRVAKSNGIYRHLPNKRIVLLAKMREANLRETGLVRRMADFLRKVLSDYTAELQPKNAVQEYDTLVEILLAEE